LGYGGRKKVKTKKTGVRRSLSKFPEMPEPQRSLEKRGGFQKKAKRELLHGTGRELSRRKKKGLLLGLKDVNACHHIAN